MVGIICACTKRNPSIQLVRHSPNTQHSIKVKQALGDTMKHTEGLREGLQQLYR